jgi:hypothetical protein
MTLMVLVKAELETPTVEAPRFSESLTAESAELSDRIVVAIDQ